MKKAILVMIIVSVVGALAFSATEVSLALPVVITSAGQSTEVETVTYVADVTDRVMAEVWDFNEYLITKYRDGYINIPNVGSSAGYPDWWLDAVGYDEGHIFGDDAYKPK